MTKFRFKRKFDFDGSNNRVITLRDLEDDPGALDALTRGFTPRFPLTVDDLPEKGIIDCHRGVGAVRPIGPENTLSGYRQAVALGAHMFDVDAGLTSDGVLVAMHDTTVDRTTNGTGDLSSFTYAALPNVEMPEIVGPGWAPEKPPTIPQILDEFGGRVGITIEPKSTAAFMPLAAAIFSRGLERSVFIKTSSNSRITETKNLGLMPHHWGGVTEADVRAAAAAGAWLMELPYNADPALIILAKRLGIKRVIAAPIWHKSQVAAMSREFDGHVSDAPGYTFMRPGERRPQRSLRLSTSAGRRGRGLRMHTRTGTEATSTDWLSPTNGLRLRNGSGGGVNLELGQFAGDPAPSGSVTFKVKFETFPTSMTSRIHLRLMVPQENTSGGDPDSHGYVAALRANGQLVLWESVDAFGAATQLGASPTSAIAANTEYTLLFEWTPTHVKLSRPGYSEAVGSTGWVESAKWRGKHMYANTTMTDGIAWLTDVQIVEG